MSLIITSIVSAYLLGVITVLLISKIKPAPNPTCPYKTACLVYNPVETKQAIKRVLTLLIENEVPSHEIKDLIDKSL
jgi:hypothetical protein